MAKHIFFEITDICNENCSHCDKKWRTDGGHTMNTDMLDRVLAIPKEYLVISGGEPGTVPDKVKYVVERCNTALSINTNLTLWTEDMLKLFNDYGTTLTVSIVSLNKETYKKITGVDLVDRLKDNLERIGKNSRMTIIVNDDNIDELESMVNYLIVRGFHNFVIQPAIPGMGAPFSWESFQARFNAVKKTYRHHRNVRIELMSYFCANGEIPVNHVCEAGEDRLVILSNGDVVPCACMAPHVLGNIMTTPWTELETNGLEYYNQFNLRDKYTCKGFLENESARVYNWLRTKSNSIPEEVYNVLTEYHIADIFTANTINVGSELPNRTHQCILANKAFYFVDDLQEFIKKVNWLLDTRPQYFICIQEKLGIRLLPMPKDLKFDGYTTHPLKKGFWLERIDA